MFKTLQYAVLMVAEIKSSRHDVGSTVLICSRGGGGLLVERMELAAELWEENMKVRAQFPHPFIFHGQILVTYIINTIQAEFVPVRDPSLTEQYEYANEHDIKCLVIITDSGMSQQGSVKVRHLDLKKEKEIEKVHLIKFLSEALAATQFRNPAIWS
ncbi:non-receptor serine/threonine protein kinase [Lithospermum erythrorhizon]|uniref:Non-receptor serine/threonine protein kinase n=1 Tax=Lithospermum erythrorhizon TaxID=34254 RepID=A0AAV3QUF3_LITER